MTAPVTVTPTRPYLVRAIYEWINDNLLTPYLLINAEEKGVFVPEQYIKDGQIAQYCTTCRSANADEQ